MIMEVNLAILWKSYKQNEDTYFRDRLISNYRPFLKSVVNHVHSRLPRTVDVMDLENYAYIGLLDAIKKFDLERNIKFETYASYRIKGAIIDGIRKQDWLSRTMRAKCKSAEDDVEHFRDEFEDCCEKDKTAELTGTIETAGFAGPAESAGPATDIESAGSAGTDRELGTAAISRNVSRNAYANDSQTGYEYEKFYMYSIDDPNFYEARVEESSDSLENIYDIYAANNSNFAEKLENKLLLKKILEKLNRHEKRIVYLYYFKGKTFKEIGKKLNITESRVSQINKQILLFLKKEIRKASFASA